MEAIEKIAKQIEAETDFEKLVELSAQASILVKDAFGSIAKTKGKLLEIIRDLDEYIERELKLGCEC